MSIYTKFPTDPQEQKSLLEDLEKKSKWHSKQNSNLNQ